MLLEVIATSVQDAKLAQEYGADRIELISGFLEGGVTPSYGLIEKVLQAVHIPVHVMMRPHANSFCYDENDLEVMVRDIRVVRELGAAGIVLGALTLDKKIDMKSLQVLLSDTGQLSVTFHMAFDELQERLSGFQQLASLPEIKRILTSGGQPSVLDAKQEIMDMLQFKRSQDIPIEIIAGSGLKVEALNDFIQQTGVAEVHMGTGVRHNGHALQQIDPSKVQAAAAIIAQYR